MGGDAMGGPGRLAEEPTSRVSTTNTSTGWTCSYADNGCPDG